MRNRILADEAEKNRFFKFTERIDKKLPGTGNSLQVTTFLRWCCSNGFFNNLSDTDIDDCYAYEILPLMKNNGICIGVSLAFISSGEVLVGIDPRECFEKTDACSVIAKFPMSRREETRFYKFIERLIDGNNEQARKWKHEAGTSWFGSYASFNCN